MQAYQSLYWGNYLYIFYNSNLEGEHEFRHKIWMSLWQQLVRAQPHLSQGTGRVDFTKYPTLQALINVWCQNIGKNIGLAETMFGSWSCTKHGKVIVHQSIRERESGVRAVSIGSHGCLRFACMWAMWQAMWDPFCSNTALPFYYWARGVCTWLRFNKWAHFMWDHGLIWNNTIDPHRILPIVGAWPSIMGWMHLLNSDDDVAVPNAMAVLPCHLFAFSGCKYIRHLKINKFSLKTK